jgi:uncharacterized RDD family membrane protein YckC
VTLPNTRGYRGQQLGLPAAGPGSLAPFGRRLLAFVIDLAGSAVVAALVLRGAPGQWSLIPWALDYLLGLLLLGRTLGMLATGLRVVRVDARAAVGPGRALARTALLALLIPGLVVDSDLRGLQDRLTATAVIIH